MSLKGLKMSKEELRYERYYGQREMIGMIVNYCKNTKKEAISLGELEKIEKDTADILDDYRRYLDENGGIDM